MVFLEYKRGEVEYSNHRFVLSKKIKSMNPDHVKVVHDIYVSFSTFARH